LRRRQEEIEDGQLRFGLDKGRAIKYG